MRHLLSKGKYLLFLAPFLVGLIAFNDYGIAWDEPQQRLLGSKTFDYVFKADRSLLEFKDRHYGVAFEWILITAENISGYNDEMRIYRLRHLATFFFFCISLIFFYQTLYRVFRRKDVAFLGAMMLFLTPRIFAHAFFNSKDIPFMSMLIIAFYTLLRSAKGNHKAMIIHGIITGLLINIRIMGIIVPLITAVYYFLEGISEKGLRKMILMFTGYLMITCLVLFISWPFLWEAPFRNIYEAFLVMKEFNWDDPVLFRGELIPAPDLPWYYVPFWILISSPLLIIILASIGAITIMRNFLMSLKGVLRSEYQRIGIIAVFMVCAPLLIIIIGDSVVYDGWRQLYFIYPFIVLIATFALNEFINKNTHGLVKQLFISLVIIYFGLMSAKMVRLHPYQQVYFSEIMPEKNNYLRKNFEMDYWGLSYLGSLRYIAENTPEGDTSRVLTFHLPGILNKKMLQEHLQERIIFVSTMEDADYFMSNYRWHPEEYNFNDKIFGIKRMGSTINAVWRLEGDHD